MQPADQEKYAGMSAEQKGAPAKTPAVTPASTVVEVGPSVSTKGPALAPDTSRTLNLADEIAGRFPSAKIDYVRPRRVKLTVPPDKIKVVALYIRDILGFDHLNVVGGTDYIQLKEFEVIYFVGSISTPGQQDIVIQLAERVDRDSPQVPSLTEVWGAAEYHERETFEMLGIVFEGHPDLRRLLLPEDWNDIPPLRKDYVSPGR
ncbi:MAG TPA: NADH-quinone oxidoreductase subunit C [Nitrososphaerales archaeon]|nr:NADH-quinone oxidoreductase subunit C [Nitrososphaerales archaeon]